MRERRIVLASGSPRRREILEQVGASFDVAPSHADERIEETDPERVVRELSLRKAREVAASCEEGRVVLGADTVVSVDGRILGKPGDEDEAVSMLLSLQGRAHEVHTGVAIVIKGGAGKGLAEGESEGAGKELAENDGANAERRGDREISLAERTLVRVAPMTEEEARAYVATGEPMDKAGAYGIQGRFAPYVDGIEGDYYNVVGLPIASIRRALKEEGIELARMRAGG